MRIPGLFGSFNKALARIQPPILTLPGNIKKQSIAAASGVQDFKRLTFGTVSNAATLDIVLTGFTAYRGLLFVLSGFLPVSDGVDLWMRFSTDGGSTFDATGYSYANVGAGDGSGAVILTNSTSAAQILLKGELGVGNASTEGINARIEIYNQASTAFWTRATWQIGYIDSSVTPRITGGNGCGGRRNAQDTDAIRFLFSSGNISAGNYAVYGLS